MDQVLEIGIRSLISFTILFILTRIMGRKQISELSFFDYITGISIGTIAGTVSFEVNTSLLAGCLALAFWTLWTILSNLIILKNIPARKLMDSEPLVVIREGQILEEMMGDRYYNVNNLLMQLRNHGIFDPTEVKLGIIETDGKLSVLKNSPSTSQANSGTTKLGINAAAKELIIDGQLLEDNLSDLQLSKNWVFSELQKQGITEISAVSLAMVTPSGKLYVDKRKDKS